MSHFVEIIENQRWYPILGWSSSLKADDPPAWSTPDRQVSQTKNEFKDFEWQVYKSEDYDEEGWLYSTDFGEDWGPMTRSAAVRMRVWMGTWRDPEAKDIDDAKAPSDEKADDDAKDEKQADASREEWKTLFAGNKESEDEKDTKAVAKEAHKSEEKATTSTASWSPLFPAAESKEDKVLFPSATSASQAETKTEDVGFFGRVSGLAFSIPSSVINLAGSSSKNAIMGTVQSIKEVSIYAMEHAQAATAAVISTEPELPVKAQRATLGDALDAKGGDDPYEMLSMLSKRFPDLSPVDRTLVTCCADDIPAYLNPPEPIVAKQCKACGHEFGMTKFRYQCGYCSESYCRDDLPHLDILRAYGQTTPSRICTNCHYILSEKIDQQFVQWRSERVDDFLSDKLVPYFNTTTDTAVDKIMRAAEGTLAAAKSAPIGATAKAAVVSADFLRKYGRAGLLGFILRNEFMQSFATLKGLMGDLDDIGFQDAAIGTYYFMAMNRGDRGSNPDEEKESHRDCPHISDDLLNEILRYAPLALHGIYELNVLDIQRISRLQNFALVYAHVQGQDVRHPSFALLGNKEKKIALVLIRGSKSVQDVLTDIQAHPEEMGLHSGSAPRSDTQGGFVDAFAHNGMLKAAMWIKDRIVSSLRKLHNEGYQIVFAGHSLGAGCAALLSVMLQKEFETLKCFAYAVPACVNLHVAESCSDFVHSVVLRDDFVPRAKASNIMKLIHELKEFKGCWRDTASEDIEAFKERAKTLWAPRKREWAREQADMRKGRLIQGAPLSPVRAERKQASPSEDAKDKVSSWTLTRTNLIDQMDKMVDSDGDEKSVPKEALVAEAKVLSELRDSLMDDPKELYIPGRVTHVYFYRGVYEAVHVDRKCDSLARIPVFQNMLSDHLGRNYLSALRIVRDSRKINPKLPEWVAFGTKTRCMCCDAPFTWNSTSSSEAQQNRDQHNCRNCGCLVCDGCSEKRKSIPEFGINVPVRVCDRCTYEL